MDEGLIKLIVMAIFVGVFVLAKIVKAVASESQRGEERQRRPDAAARPSATARPRSPAMDEVRRFLEEVRRQAQQAAQGTMTPAPRQRPTPRRVQPETLRPRPTSRPARPQPAASLGQKSRPARLAAAPPIVLEEVKPARRRQVTAPPQRAPQAAPAAAPEAAAAPRSHLFAMLPQAELKRAVLLHEILGPPRALRGPHTGPRR